MSWGIAEIRGWLLQHPRPVTLRVVANDDRHHEVSIGGSWMAIAQSVHALSPTLIECHDEKGKIIRAVRPQDDENTGDNSSKHALPLQMPSSVDPQSAQLIHFADLLAAAYRHTTDVAFERLASLFEASVRRSESLERTIDKLVREKIRAELDGTPPEAPEPDQLSQMVQGFMQAAQAGQHENGATPNGKGQG